MNRIFVCVGQHDGKPTPIPSDLRDRINAFMMG
jgi:acyl-CoA thioesterase FadM